MKVFAMLLLACAQREELTPGRFQSISALIKPQRGESRWAQIPWLLSFREARHKAAAEGKPLLLWSGGGSAPLGGC